MIGGPMKNLLKKYLGFFLSDHCPPLRNCKEGAQWTQTSVKFQFYQWQGASVRINNFGHLFNDYSGLFGVMFAQSA